MVDESAGKRIAEFLTDQGHNSISVTEKYLGFSDRDLLIRAQRQGRIIVTLDKDFGELIFYHRLNSHGLILLRLDDESVENKIRVLKGLLEKYPQRLKGSFITLTDDKIRIRKI